MRFILMVKNSENQSFDFIALFFELSDCRRNFKCNLTRPLVHKDNIVLFCSEPVSFVCSMLCQYKNSQSLVIWSLVNTDSFVLILFFSCDTCMCIHKIKLNDKFPRPNNGYPFDLRVHSFGYIFIVKSSNFLAVEFS